MAKYAYGIDIGGTRVKAGLVDILSGKILASRIFNSKKEEQPFLDSLKDALQSMQAEIEIKEVCGAGVSVTGFVHRAGIMGKSKEAFLPFLSGYPIAQRLETTLDMPVKVDSDGRIVCYGECLYGAGKGYERVLLITLGTGIGFSILENAVIPSEPAVLHMGGHVKVKNSNRKCYCGLTGCFEQQCSGPALMAEYRSASGSDASGKEIFSRAIAGEKAATDVVESYLESLCCGLNQFIFAHAPDVIVIGGGVANGLENYIDRIREQVTAKCYDTYHCDIKLAQLGDMAGVIGAAALMQQP